MLTHDAFLRDLRSDLNHLYDPNHLRRSALAALFGVADRFDTSSRLQSILLDGIQALKPKTGPRTLTASWIAYEVLHFRYVEQLSQDEVAAQLGVSDRQLRREQDNAIKTLAYQLWQRFALGDQPAGDGAAQVASADADVSGRAVSDLGWLKTALPDAAADLGDTLQAVARLAAPLANRHEVTLHVNACSVCPTLAVHPMALRQMLLSSLTAAIQRSHGGRVDVMVEMLLPGVQIRVVGAAGAPVAASPPQVAGMDVAQDLVSLCNGSLSVTVQGTTTTIVLALPEPAQAPILVVDDNRDAVQLMQRFAAATHYNVIGADSLDQALAIANRVHPQVIVLDVMMPQVDGWEALGRLQQHPTTAGTPIVIATILDQQELALALGASGYLRKPITRQSFLAALDQAAAAGRESP
jgi:CheY-like chemotaxis protein/predicted DNA-binding protein (UPF0251 family)